MSAIDYAGRKAMSLRTRTGIRERTGRRALQLEMLESRVLLSGTALDGTYSVSESWSVTITNPYSSEGSGPPVIHRTGTATGSITVTNGQFSLVNKTGHDVGDVDASLDFDGSNYHVSSQEVAYAFASAGGKLYAVMKFAFFEVLVTLPSNFGWTLFSSDGTYTADGSTLSNLQGSGSATDANGLDFEATSVAVLKPGPRPAGPHLTFQGQPTSGVAGNAIVSDASDDPVAVEVRDAKGNLLAGDATSVTLALGDPAGGAILGGTLTAPVVDGVATFNDLSLSKAGKYTLVASDGLYTTAKSRSFSIAADTSTSQLVLMQQPGDTMVGKALAPKIILQVQDQFGNLVTTDHSKVSLSIDNGPLGGSISGTTTVTVSKGVATFSKAILSTAGDYVLAAADASLGIPTPVTFAQTILQGVTKVAAPHAASSYVFGKSIPLSTTLKSTAPGSVPFSGTASIFDLSNHLLGTANVSANGSVKFALAGVVPGTYVCAVSYPGDANHTAFTSSHFTVLVKPAGTKTVLQASAKQLAQGESLTLSASVTSSGAPGTARTGSVKFMDGTTVLDTVPLDVNSGASLTFIPTAAGTHSYSAVYLADDNFLGSTSASNKVKMV